MALPLYQFPIQLHPDPCFFRHSNIPLTINWEISFHWQPIVFLWNKVLEILCIFYGATNVKVHYIHVIHRCSMNLTMQAKHFRHIRNLEVAEIGNSRVPQSFVYLYNSKSLKGSSNQR